MSKVYPINCPHCGETLKGMSQHDLHVERNHTEEEANAAVLRAIIKELQEDE